MTIRLVDATLRPGGRGFTYECDIKDNAGNVLGAGDLSSLTLQLYDQDTRTICAGTDPPVDVKGVGRGSFDGTTKRFSLTLSDADNALVVPGSQYERHVAWLRWQVNADLGGDHEIEYALKRLGP